MHELLVLILSFVGAILAIGFGVHTVISKSGNRSQNLLLSMVMFGFAIRLLRFALNEIWGLNRWQHNLAWSGLLMMGACIWLYGKAIVEKRFRLTTQHIVHFIPALLFIVFCWCIPGTSQSERLMVGVLVVAHFSFYLLLSLNFGFTNLVDRTSSEHIRWYSQIVAVISIIGLFFLLVYSPVFSFYVGSTIFYSIVVVVLFLFVIRRHSAISKKHMELGDNLQHMRELVEQFTARLKHQRDYLNPKLTVNTAAELIDVNARDLSRAINEQCDCNFSEFINKFRVQRAQEILIDPQRRNTKVAVIGVECGFGNTTSFNSAFKELVGKTPSEFRKQLTTNNITGI